MNVLTLTATIPQRARVSENGPYVQDWYMNQHKDNTGLFKNHLGLYS